MRAIILEVRDRATCIGVLAVELSGESRLENTMLTNMGWDLNYPSVSLTILSSGCSNSRTELNPYLWTDRTMHNAHRHIQKHFHELDTGDIVDVRVILEEQDYITCEKELS